MDSLPKVAGNATLVKAAMDRFENQRWTSREVARMISVFESERRFYDEIVTMLPVPLATVGIDGAILSANRAFLAAFQISREELERQSLDVVFKDIPWRHALKPFEPESVVSGNYKALFTPVPRWDRGETEWTVVLMDQGAPVQAPAPPAATADPELIATSAGIEAAQRLAGRVTHETNNLIMIASGYGREILSQLPADSPLREDVSMLLDATGRIEAMTAQLNEFSRTGRGDKSAHSLRDLLAATGYHIVAGLKDAAVLTDRAALTAIFAALPLIAAGPLQLESEVTAQEAVVTVKGFGMSAETLRQQFEALNKAARGGHAGARECAMVGPKMLQAGVRWRVIEPGALEMHIPLAGNLPAAPAQSALVVDDQTGIRAIVRRILEGRGFAVTDAASGEEALSLLDRRKEPFALLVTDMRMPGMTGRDLADRVRFRHPETRILFISGFTDDPSIQSGILPAHAGFLPKPFHPDQLVDAVTKLMA